MTYRILVCDDEPALAQSWLAAIEASTANGPYEILPIPQAKELEGAIAGLLARRSAVREGKAVPGDDNLFDQADILVVDYDLIHVDEGKARYSGEAIARLARAFSRPAVIIVLNQFPEAQFDLSLRGHPASHADLNVDADLIGTRSLWQPEITGEFRPWHWPVLSQAVERFRRRENFLLTERNLDRTLAEVFGIEESDLVRMSDSAFGFVAPDAESFEGFREVTFRKFLLNNSAAADPKDAEKLADVDPAACARIAASRISKWLDRELVGPQDTLVDVPHLVLRYPFLLGNNATSADAWSNLSSTGAAALAGIADLKHAWFAAEDWLLRPALWWARVEAAEAVRSQQMAFDYASVPDLAFLEDASTFGDRPTSTAFRAGFHNEFDRRYIKEFAGIRYAPQRRLAFA